jgi:hypothetical protein
MGCWDDIPVSGLLVIDAVGWRPMYFVVMPRVNRIVIFLTYHVYLYSINHIEITGEKNRRTQRNHGESQLRGSTQGPHDLP